MLVFNFLATVTLALTLAACIVSGKGYKPAEETELQAEA